MTPPGAGRRESFQLARRVSHFHFLRRCQLCRHSGSRAASLPLSSLSDITSDETTTLVEAVTASAGRRKNTLLHHPVASDRAPLCPPTEQTGSAALFAFPPAGRGAGSLTKAEILGGQHEGNGTFTCFTCRRLVALPILRTAPTAARGNER